MPSIKGTASVEDSRAFSKAMKKTKFPAIFQTPLSSTELSKINRPVMEQWIEQQITELLGFEDEIVHNTATNLFLPETNEDSAAAVDPRRAQLDLAGFLGEEPAAKFSAQLWEFMILASKEPTGIPRKLLDDKKKELAAKNPPAQPPQPDRYQRGLPPPPQHREQQGPPPPRGGGLPYDERRGGGPYDRDRGPYERVPYDDRRRPAPPYDRPYERGLPHRVPPEDPPPRGGGYPPPRRHHHERYSSREEYDEYGRRRYPRDHHRREDEERRPRRHRKRRRRRSRSESSFSSSSSSSSSSKSRSRS